MIKIKSFFYLICLILIAFISSGFKGCSLTQDRPVLKVPDANQDRMLKEIFAGTKDKPKYWMSMVTVIDGQLDFNTTGFRNRPQLGYFEFEKDKLIYYNAATRRFLEEPIIALQSSAQSIFEWDVEHSEFRLKEVDGYTTNQEEENNYIPWEQKRYFTIDWKGSQTIPRIGYCGRKNIPITNMYIIDSSREMTEDYISFVLNVNCQLGDKDTAGQLFKEKYRFSFKKVPDPRLKDDSYTPYVYDGEKDPLFNKYGYFYTSRPNIAKDNRDENIFYMNRWNPNKKHVFYFGENYPEEYKYLAHGVICKTNQLFAKNGLNDYKGECKADGSEHEQCMDKKCMSELPMSEHAKCIDKQCVAKLPSSNVSCSKGICFEVRENTGQQKMGDIRYSFFHALGFSHDIYGGYGPSNPHPTTGEIMSGSVFIDFSNLDFSIEYLFNKRYQRKNLVYTNKEGGLEEQSYKTTKYDSSPIFSYMKQLLNEEDHTKWTNTSKAIDKDSSIRSDFNYLVSELTYADPRWSRTTRSHPKNSFMDDIHQSFNLLNQKLPDDNLPFLSNLSQEISNIHSDIQKDPTSLENLDDLKNLNDESFKEIFSDIHAKNTLYPIAPVIAQIPNLLADGRTVEEVKKIVLFNLFSHEFGHVLNLRHNFYGSFDSSHWHPEIKTSSVMDYPIFEKKTEGPSKAFFGPYDEAALVYAYSNGTKDLSKEKQTHYLYCTDQHVKLNFLCNHWDYGQTPSEVMMSLIENYEDSYFIRNLRINRAWWNTRYYPYNIFETMLNIKKAFLMWKTAFNDIYLSLKLNESEKKLYTSSEKTEISDKIQQDIKQAIKLSMAFYSSVIQDRQRPVLNKYHTKGEASIEQIGTLYDKIFAMIFLMGDLVFSDTPYNPEEYLAAAAFMTDVNQLGFREMIEEIMETTMTRRVDDIPWFIYYARLLYADMAMNYYSRQEGEDLIEDIAVLCYKSPESLKKHRGIDILKLGGIPDGSVMILNNEDYLQHITNPNYRLNEKIGIAHRGEKYYIAFQTRNKYSFPLFEQLNQQETPPGTTRGTLIEDIYSMFYLYHRFKNSTLIDACQ